MKLRGLWGSVILLGIVFGLAKAADRSELFKGDYDQGSGGQLHVDGKKILSAVIKQGQDKISLRSELKRVSSVPEGRDGVFGGMDRKFLDVLRQVIGGLKGVECKRDLNSTLEAIERREAWAVASEYSTRSLFFFHIFVLIVSFTLSIIVKSLRFL